MTDPADKKTGFQPAPWEAGKRPTQGPNSPPGYGAPPPAAPPGYGAPPPAANPGYGAPPPAGYLGVPMGGPASNAFGGDTGRGRTRQIPQQQPGPAPQGYAQPGPAYPPPPQGYQQPAGYQQPPQGYPQQAPYPQPAGVPPQPYGADAAYPARKPTTVLGILSLVAIGVGMMAGLFSLGLFSPPFLLAGAILGYLGMRETASWGKKSGRGLALGGTIANLILLVLNVGVLLLGFLAFQATGEAIEKSVNTEKDAAAIEKGLEAYANAKGDLLPGGPQIRHGGRTEVAVTGPALTVADVVSPAELSNPIEEYSLKIDGDLATIYWTAPDGTALNVGGYMHFDMSRFR